MRSDVINDCRNVLESPVVLNANPRNYVSPHRGAKALMVGGDPLMLEIFAQVFCELDINTDTCVLEPAAVDQSSSEKGEALGLDLNGAEGHGASRSRVEQAHHLLLVRDRIAGDNSRNSCPQEVVA